MKSNLLGKILLVTLGLSALALQPEQALARRRTGPGGEFRMRVSPIYGTTDFTDLSYATSSTTKLSEYHLGGRMQLEGWFNSSFGLMLDTQVFYIEGVAGKPLYHYYGNVPLAWRIFGAGGAMANETVLYWGPGISVWPDLRTYYNQPTIDLAYPKVFGAKGGIRWRMMVAPNYSLELDGNYTMPFKILGIGNAALSTTETRSVGGSAYIDYRYYDGMGVGLGYMYELNRLSYIPNGNKPFQPQTITINYSAFLLSFRFWF